jgi:hypothetical protein
MDMRCSYAGYRVVTVSCFTSSSLRFTAVRRSALVEKYSIYRETRSDAFSNALERTASDLPNIPNFRFVSGWLAAGRLDLSLLRQLALFQRLKLRS